jgi:hypothetical protein
MDDRMDSVLNRFPNTVEKAVDLLTSDLSFQERTKLANMSELGLVQFHAQHGHHIRSRFRIPGNDPLVKDCKKVAGLPDISPEQASFVIFKTMVERLKQTNVLKVVK